MAKKTSTAFIAASDPDQQKILDAIRAPEKEYLTEFYVAQRSKEVAGLLLQLAKGGEGDTAVRFITSRGRRFDTLEEKGQLGTLMDMLEALSPAQQLKIMKSSEKENYGSPNVTVLQTIIGTKDKELMGRAEKIMRGFDDVQCTQLLAAPMAVWWMSSYDKTPLLCDLLEPLSIKQRQRIINSAKPVGQAVEMACDARLDSLFEKCKRTLKPARGMAAEMD